MALNQQGGETMASSHIDSDDESEDLDDFEAEASLSKAGKGLTESLQDSRDSDEENAFSRRENIAVFRLRVFVIMVLLLAAVTVCLVVFYITKEGEKANFENQYTGFANKVVKSFEGIVKQKIEAMSALGVAMIAHGIDHHRTWPFVTLSSFQERSATTREQSKAIYVRFSPRVKHEDRAAWENYIAHDPDGSKWVTDAINYQEKFKRGIQDMKLLPQDNSTTGVISANPGYIHYLNDYGIPQSNEEEEDYFPTWETSPLLKGEVNSNLLKRPEEAEYVRKTFESAHVMFGNVIYGHRGEPDRPGFNTKFSDSIEGDHSTISTNWPQMFAALLSIQEQKPVEYYGDPMSNVYLPVFNAFNSTRTPVAVMIATINWKRFFVNTLPSTAKGIWFVLENPCNEKEKFFTYSIDGGKDIEYEENGGGQVQYEGPGDLHDPKFNLEISSSFDRFDKVSDGTELGLMLEHGNCPYSIHVYPSQQFYHDYHTNIPLWVTIAVAIIFIFTAAMFFVYDHLVERRQRLVLTQAIKSSAIVSSLFPKNVRERLMDDGKEQYMGRANRLKSFLGGTNDQELGQQPIADLFPHATVLFADIAGFTAWSSSRDPGNVFVLLQTVYQAFDVIANRRRVFKVETIGDSYVAVTGLPEPQADHAVIMSKFASDCLVKMNELVRELEIALGPGTGDLTMRFGMHSGPVTAGVLRGERSRFQLFGDTVNTAARMETTGERGRIQASQATADILVAAGKAHWVKPREDKVEAKGKGVMHTFWVTPSKKLGDLSSSFSLSSDMMGKPLTEVKLLLKEDSAPVQRMRTLAETDRHDRWIDWMVELLKDYVKKIIAKRQCQGKPIRNSGSFRLNVSNGHTALDEVVEMIQLPAFDERTVDGEREVAKTIEISEAFTAELRHYVASIAYTYRNNSFHNFEHACHVTMSVHKFLQRITTPDIDVGASGGIASQLHDYTHGINSDPLTMFAIVFSALIHDADHRGVSNTQLSKEDEVMASLYKNKSVAEQNSLAIAWDLLVSDGYEELRSYLFADIEEFMRFRQIVVNIVLATDIFDKELNGLRKSRWEKAFSASGASAAEINDLRATIVMEHIIQASDVSHTMQHWHIYRKWNMRLFEEMTQAYQAGRMAKDPATFWYQGELGFFDNYVIPLARKLKDCNIFGVSSDECLNYALRNRAEWADRGKQIVEEMIPDYDAADEVTRSS